jgi:hypothetical protein
VEEKEQVSGVLHGLATAHSIREEAECPETPNQKDADAGKLAASLVCSSLYSLRRDSRFALDCAL